jgi:hypothetical protein
LDELAQIRDEVRICESSRQLRRYFERIHGIRRQNIDDFDIQLLVADVQDEIISRVRALRVQPASKFSFDEPLRVATEVPRPASRDREGVAEIPPEVPRVDAQTWQRAIYIAVTLTVLICAGFFYLIQAARRINLPDQRANIETRGIAGQDNTGASSHQNALPLSSAAISPTLRLYTDLVPGIVSIDDGPEQDLKDGELAIDHLQPGTHAVRVSGRSGTASFSFQVAKDRAPEVAGIPSASNAMAVLLSEQDGKARVVTNAEHSTLALDGKAAGEIGPEGLALSDFAKADHDLLVIQDNDRQRFVWTYTPAPALTVYIKSDPNAGTVVVMAGQDGVTVSIDGKPYRRLTSQGPLRIPLRVGEYTITAHKKGFIDPPPQTVEVKKAEESAVEFSLLPAPQTALLEVKAATPGTSVLVDRNIAGVVGPDGSLQISNIAPGAHSIELRREEATPKKFERTFQAGGTVLLTGSDVELSRAAPAEIPAAIPATKTADDKAERTDQSRDVNLPGEHVQRGGGFVAYHVTRVPGQYSFAAQGRIGGFLKHSKLQWYAAYRDSDNYVLFTLDGKHAIVREIRDGKPQQVGKTPFTADSNQWVQVDLSVKPEAISARVKNADGNWSELAAVQSRGRDFTQGKVGFYVPGNDEVAIANFRFNTR